MKTVEYNLDFSKIELGNIFPVHCGTEIKYEGSLIFSNSEIKADLTVKPQSREW